MNSSGSKVNGESFVSEVVFKKTCLKGRRGGSGILQMVTPKVTPRPMQKSSRYLLLGIEAEWAFYVVAEKSMNHISLSLLG